MAAESSACRGRDLPHGLGTLRGRACLRVSARGLADLGQLKLLGAKAGLEYFFNDLEGNRHGRLHEWARRHQGRTIAPTASGTDAPKGSFGC
jgi:hypothetical protein